jgi:tetratricopeptide (TPR) repeat protein
LLAELTSAHLLADRSRGRFAFHDLLRAYARELADVHDSAEERRAAINRVLDHYLWTAYRAHELLDPNGEDAISLPRKSPLVTPEELGDHRGALAWFTTEYQVLLAALRQAVYHGFDVHAWQLPWALARFFDRRGHGHDAANFHQIALEAANRLGDPYAQAVSHRYVAAFAYVPLRRYAEAEDHLGRALALYQRLGDDAGQAEAHWSLALLLDRQDRYAAALDHAQQAYELFQTAGNRTGQARAMNGLGWFNIQLGRYQSGLSYCEQALELQREIGDQDYQADTLDSMATAYTALGNYAAAIAHYQQAVLLYREFGHRPLEGDILTCLGDLYLANGSPLEARDAWQDALAIFGELGHPGATQVSERLDKLTSSPSMVSPA